MERAEGVKRIAKTSNNLKGTYVKELNDASNYLTSVITTLAKSPNLQDPWMMKTGLRKMIAELKQDVTQLQVDNEDLKRRLRGEMPPPRETIEERTIKRIMGKAYWSNFGME